MAPSSRAATKTKAGKERNRGDHEDAEDKRVKWMGTGSAAGYSAVLNTEGDACHEPIEWERNAQRIRENNGWEITRSGIASFAGLNAMH